MCLIPVFRLTCFALPPPLILYPFMRFFILSPTNSSLHFYLFLSPSYFLSLFLLLFFFVAHISHYTGVSRLPRQFLGGASAPRG